MLSLSHQPSFFRGRKLKRPPITQFWNEHGYGLVISWLIRLWCQCGLPRSEVDSFAGIVSTLSRCGRGWRSANNLQPAPSNLKRKWPILFLDYAKVNRLKLWKVKVFLKWFWTRQKMVMKPQCHQKWPTKNYQRWVKISKPLFEVNIRVLEVMTTTATLAIFCCRWLVLLVNFLPKYATVFAVAPRKISPSLPIYFPWVWPQAVYGVKHRRNECISFSNC